MPATNFPNGIRGPILNASEAQEAAIVDLTDNSGGTAADTIAAIGATYSQTEVQNAIASLAAKVNELNAALQAAQITAS
ncbi:hypothetical protein N6L27_03475 [Leisingera sp. SS27]|uniref:hypothetical protein n=1 Tax=Leisingera sp. SS27 TaxID=2979462 RepID=UPI00232F1AD1|nr:hypothetical protein [Leisingera sp. SS27]MDC0657051.1 hypothetical protein [Leisingera sp. SS27]